MWELFEVIWRNEKRSKFQQYRCQNSNKEYERGERNDVMAGVRKNLNFVNQVTEIPATQMKCPKERSARKEKSNCGNQVAKNEGGKICGNQVAKIVGEEREKFNRNFGNQVAENGKKEKKNYGNQVAKIVGEERENFNRNFGNEVAKNGEKRKEKEMWQTGNGFAKNWRSQLPLFDSYSPKT